MPYFKKQFNELEGIIQDPVEVTCDLARETTTRRTTPRVHEIKSQTTTERVHEIMVMIMAKFRDLFIFFLVSLYKNLNENFKENFDENLKENLKENHRKSHKEEDRTRRIKSNGFNVHKFDSVENKRRRNTLENNNGRRRNAKLHFVFKNNTL